MDRELSKLKRARELDPESADSKEAYERAKRRELPRRELLDDITMLFDPDFDAYLVTVLGLALGDPASKISVDKVLGLTVEGESGIRFRKSLDSDVFNGMCEQILALSGFVFVADPAGDPEKDRIGFFIVNSRISKIEIASSILQTLQLNSETAIQEKWGGIDFYDRSMSDTTFVPGPPCFVVIWAEEQQCVVSVALGKEAVAEVQQFSAVDLVQWSFDWSPEDRLFEEAIEDLTGVQRIRGLRLRALFEAFGLFERGINSVQQLFGSAHLIAESWEGRLLELWSVLEQEGFADPAHLTSRDDFTRRGVRFLWWRFVDFQRHLNATVEYGAGAGAGGFHFTVHNHTRTISKSLIGERDRINKILSLLLDPEQRVFTWGELVRNHQFPDEDLCALQNEWY